MDPFVNFVLFLAVFGLLVFVHEWGHFIAARLTGTKVNEFAIGFGPKLWSKKRGDTNWILRLVPFGGYCAIEGQEVAKTSPDSYTQKNYFQKVLILVGGVLMNFLLSVVIFYFLVGYLGQFSAAFPKITDTDFIFGKQSLSAAYGAGFVRVIEDSPAAKAGIKGEGAIKKVAGVEVYASEDLVKELAKHKEKEIKIEIAYIDGGVRDEIKEYKVTPDSKGKIGVELKSDDLYILEYTGLEKPFVGFAHSINLLQFQVEGISGLVRESAVSRDVAPVAKNVSGPIGIFYGVGIFLKVAGLIGILNLVGMLSLALAFFNIIPFPALDGGHIFIVSLEKIIGKEIPAEIQNIIAAAGFFILVALMILVTVKDLLQFGILNF